jgi:acyl-CoA synthetase (AMP-forming)/AMP-acid ligase II
MLYKKLIEDNLDDSVIIRYKDQTYTYKDLYYSSLALGKEWISKGVKIGDRVIVSCANKAETVIALLACLAYGMIFVPVEHDIGDKAYIQQDCQAKFVYTGGQPENIEGEERVNLPPETTGYIIYTSGSTDKPKGVVAPIFAIDFCIEAINKRIGNNENDRILSRLPLSFDYGLYQVFLALRFRSVLTFVDNETPLLSIPRILVEQKITALPVVPTMLSALLNARVLKGEYCPYLRYICSTGEVLSIDIIKKVHNALPNVLIIPMYGLTECKRVSIMPPHRWDKIMAGSCGLPLDGTTVKLIDEGEKEGELIIYGPNVMNGYWGDEESSSNIFCVDECGQRYLRTGDSFFIDNEGFLYFRHRLKNMIKVSGYAVSGADIEDLLKCIEGVIDIRVFGLPDKVYGEKVCACIYTNEAGIKEKIEELSKKLPFHKQIRKIVLYNNPFPVNKNGKVDINVLRKQAGNTYEL